MPADRIIMTSSSPPVPIPEKITRESIIAWSAHCRVEYAKLRNSILLRSAFKHWLEKAGISSKTAESLAAYIPEFEPD